MRRSCLATLLSLLAAGPLPAQGTRGAVLFDATHHQCAGTSAEWVICTGEGPDPLPANPSCESCWNGGLSALGYDLYRQGYRVQSLPAKGGRITWRDPSNPQDLSRYSVFFIPECYTWFTPEEKRAIVRFVQEGGGLFLLGNHEGATRAAQVPGSSDAYHIFNDLVCNNGVADHAFGFTWAGGHGPQDPEANTTSCAYAEERNALTDAIIRGPNGTLSLQDFHSYAYLRVDRAANPSAQGILATQVRGDASADCFIAACALGKGRVVALGDSSPCDDGTTSTPGKKLHDSYTRNSNRAFFLNAVRWLTGASGPAPSAEIRLPSGDTRTVPGCELVFQAHESGQASRDCRWDFGDGCTAQGPGPLCHAYPAAGSYTATLTVCDDCGASSVTSRRIIVGAPAAAIMTEDFEYGSKGGYGPGQACLATGTWTLDDAVLGNAPMDRKNGRRAVRLRGGGTLTMDFDFPGGARSLSVGHARFGSDAPASWSLWSSMDAGRTWKRVGEIQFSTATTLQTARFQLDLRGSVRFRIRKEDGSPCRLDLDDVRVEGF